MHKSNYLGLHVSTLTESSSRPSKIDPRSVMYLYIRGPEDDSHKESKHVAQNNYFYVLIKLFCLTDIIIFYYVLRNASGWPNIKRKRK